MTPIDYCNAYAHSKRTLPFYIEWAKSGDLHAIREIRRKAGLMAKCKRELIEVHNYPVEVFR